MNVGLIDNLACNVVQGCLYDIESTKTTIGFCLFVPFIDSDLNFLQAKTNVIFIISNTKQLGSMENHAFCLNFHLHESYV